VDWKSEQIFRLLGRIMTSFENRVKDTDKKSAQDKRRLELVFTKLGDVLVEIATHAEIHPTDKNLFYPLPAIQGVCQLQAEDTKSAVSVPPKPKPPSDNNIEHGIDEMET
jgi:hypothetical protein